ncbi:DUF3592 domain-containing protein [Streptomyces sp. NPDC047085]|uniref:DUF3592 domain-containing protein n=1 Tax=Streptomyces sp. NPDC047085 TaxID=3155140 RepID=UPI00340FD6B0
MGDTVVKWLLLVLSVGLAVGAGRSAYRHYRLSWHGVWTTVVVSDADEHVDGDGVSHFHPRLLFTPEGGDGPVSVRAAGSKSYPLSLPMEVRVRYDPARPTWVKVEGFTEENGFVGTAVSAAIGVVGVVWLTVLLLRG